ncbi:MAG: hypothetical protein ACOYNC_06545 [Bacteroidales bacterium]
MKNICSFILFFVLVSAIPPVGLGQQIQIQVPLDGTETFRQIVEKNRNYLKTLPDDAEKLRYEKHFARWAWYTSLHLGPAGEFVNVPQKTLDAYNQLNSYDAPLTSANGSWSFVGPASDVLGNPSAGLMGHGRVDRIAFHPTDGNIIYVGTPAGGLWRTTNAGTSWTAISSYIPSLGISGIVVDHNDPNTLYVLTGDGDSFEGGFVSAFGYIRKSIGVMVSHDAGVTWQTTGPLSSIDYCGSKLIQHPTNSSILIAATTDGVYRTTNGGTTWTQVTPGRYYDVEFKPGSPSTVYASGRGYFRYSTNTGSTWLSSTFDYNLCIGRSQLAVTPNSPGKVYLLAGPATNGDFTFCGFYVSTNSGVSFTRLTTAPNILGNETGFQGDQSGYDMGLDVNPTDNQKVVAAGVIIWKSANGGSTFTYGTTYGDGPHYIHPDVHDVAYNPLNNIVYAATDGGLYGSIDNGASWGNLSAGINTTQFYHLDDYDADPNFLLGGCQDNGVKYRYYNTSAFSHLIGADGFDGAIDYTNGLIGYSTSNTTILHFSNFILTSPTQVAKPDDYFFPQVELNTSNPDVLYFSYNTISKYVFSTGTTTALGSGSILGAWVLRTCPSNSNRIYAAGGLDPWSSTGSLFESADGGSTWTTLSDNTGFPATFPRISDIGVRPNNSGLVYVCFSGYTDGLKVLYSTNTGNTWTNISYDLPNIPINSIVVDQNNNVYAGGDLGVYYHASGSTNWEPFYNNIPNVPVTQLCINENNDQLLAATFGRGVWKSTLRAACPADVTLAGNLTGNYFRSASNSITASGNVIGSTGNSVVLRSNNYVKLTSGFQASSDIGNKFLGTLGPCDSGMPPAFSTTQEQGPVFPAELNAYTVAITRHDGTLEVVTGTNGQKEVLLRQFAPGTVKIILATPGGQVIRNVADFTGEKGSSTFNLGADTAPGNYYLYLVVNGKVMHLQEVTL